MKHLFIVLLTLLWIPAFSQARMGNTLAQLITEFPEGIKGNTDNYVTYTTTLISTKVVYFLKEDQVTITGIYPMNQITVNGYVERYNANYVILSSKTWRAYMEKGILNIELCFVEGKIPYFMWTYPEAQ
jgi:hypothetical protein